MKALLFGTCLFGITFLSNTDPAQQQVTKTPIAAKISFSTQPFGTPGAVVKNSFTSGEHIYGRLELSSGTIKEIFQIDENNRYPSLIMDLAIMKGDYVTGSSRKNYMLIKDNGLSLTYFDFDITPSPEKASTVFAMLSDFDGALGISPLGVTIMNAQLETGNYQVEIKIFNTTKNAYGKENDAEKWPLVKNEFSFSFSENDVAKIDSERKKAQQLIKENAFRYSSLPAVFSKSATITDPKATNAKILAILKRDLPQRQILKVAIENDGGPLWHIAHDDYGLPKYRYFNRTVWVAYKLDGLCRVGTASLREVYSGGGTYGALGVGFTSASSKQDNGIDCVKIK